MKFHGIQNLEDSIIEDKDSKEEIVIEDCEEAIIEIGSNGKFQKIALAILTICYTCTGAYITNSFVFFEKDPIIECFNNNEWLQCKRTEACKANKTYRFNFTDQPSYSWTNDFRMGCDKNFTIGLFGTIFFLGSMISSLFASSLSDYIGRATLIKVSMLIRNGVILLPLIYANEYLILVSLFLLGLLNSLHSTIPYILISEYVSRYEKDKYQTIMFIFESFSGLLSTLYFYLFQNWKIFLILNLMYGLIFTVYSYKILESPRYLVSKNNYDEAKIVLKAIAKVNLGRNVDIRFEKEENLMNKTLTIKTNETVATSLLCRSKKLRPYLIILSFIWFSTAFAFFAIQFQIKYLDLEIYYSNFLLFTSEATSYMISNKLMYCLGKKNSMIFSFLISFISYLIFFLVEKPDPIWVIVLIFFSKFGAAAILNISSIYSNEVFPTDIRGRAIAICSFVGKFGGIIAPSIVENSQYTLIISAAVCLVSCFILIPLKNSYSNASLTETIHDVEEEVLDK